MPQNHFRCPVCGRLQLRAYRVADVGGPDWPLLCEDFFCDGRVELAPLPGDFTIDAKEPFQRFVIHRDVYEKNPETGNIERFQRPEVVDSTHTMRRIEADSERRFRNGEGEPLRFRALSMNRSNLDQGSFGVSGKIGEQAYDAGNPPVQKSGRVHVTRHGADKPEIPVARGAGESPLKG